RQARAAVVAEPLGVGAINDADCPFETRRREGVACLRLVEDENEPLESDVVKEPLVAAIERRTNALALRGLVPIGSRRHAAGVRREADQSRLSAVLLAHELTQIDL